MINKKILTLFVSICILYPHTAKADMDMISFVSNAISTAQEQINKITKIYIGLQANLQQLNLNRNILGDLKNQVKSELQNQAKAFASSAISSFKSSFGGSFQMFFNTKIGDLTLPGIDQFVNMGAFVNPELKNQLGETYLKKTNVSDDVMESTTQDERNNDLMVENVSIMFANALMNRKHLQDEADAIAKEEEGEKGKGGLTDVPQIMFKYKQTSQRANHRWINVLASQSSFMKQRAESFVTQGRVDDVSDVTGVVRSGGDAFKFNSEMIDIEKSAYDGTE